MRVFSLTYARLLLPALVLPILAGCLRDPDVNKITCNRDEGCPVGYVCNLATKHCCRPADGVSCTSGDAAMVDEVGHSADGSVSVEVASRMDGSSMESYGHTSEAGSVAGTGGRLGADGAAGSGGTSGAGDGGEVGDVPSISGTGGASGAGASLGTGGNPGAGGAAGAPDGSVDRPIGAGGTGANGGTRSTGGVNATGGLTAAAGAVGTGGATRTGGAANGGTTVGAGGGSGGSGTGGAVGSGGTTGLGGTPGTGGSVGTGGTANGGAAVPSSGCSKPEGLETLTANGTSVAGGLPTSTRLTISSGGTNREYIIDVPADYEPTHPYRLIFSWHQAYGSDTGNAIGQYPANNGPNFDAAHYAYYGLRREATDANQPAIFVAPHGVGNFPWDYNRDVVLFDDLLALVTTNLCIDESRVFTTGFSFGAMMSYALSIGRATKLRGAVAMAAANYNFTQPTNDHLPLAYFGTTGMSDGTCPWGDDSRGGKACVLQHAQDNACTIPATIPTATGSSKSYLCYDFAGCRAGYPVRVCTFDGGHTPSAVVDGTNGGDDGLNAFIPPLAWKFIAGL